MDNRDVTEHMDDIIERRLSGGTPVCHMCHLEIPGLPEGAAWFHPGGPMQCAYLLIDALSEAQGRIVELEGEVGRLVSGLVYVKDALTRLDRGDYKSKSGAYASLELALSDCVNEAYALLNPHLQHQRPSEKAEQQPTTLTKEGGGGE